MEVPHVSQQKIYSDVTILNGSVPDTGACSVVIQACNFFNTVTAQRYMNGTASSVP